MHACACKRDCIIHFLMMAPIWTFQNIRNIIFLNCNCHGYSKNVDPYAIIDSQFPILMCLSGLRLPSNVRELWVAIKLIQDDIKFTYP